MRQCTKADLWDGKRNSPVTSKNIELTEWWIFSDIVTSHFDKVTEQQIQRK